MVLLTSLTLLVKSSAWEMGVGNFPAALQTQNRSENGPGVQIHEELTLGETWTQETRNLLDESLRSKESVVFLGKSLCDWEKRCELLFLI